jgi:multidrug efflux pump subunit AcrA (membrane-fusion protein)
VEQFFLWAVWEASLATLRLEVHLDVPRQPRRRHGRILIGLGLGVLLLATLGISRLKPAPPSLKRSDLYIDTVKHGTMIREVRGDGTLVPEDQRIVSAMTAGRVERVLVRPGVKVEANTLLIELSNPDVQLQSLDAERQVKLAEADLANLRASLEGDRLVAVSSVSAARTALHEAERNLKVAERLTTDGLASPMEIDRARDQLQDATERYDSEQARLNVLAEALKAQLALKQSEVGRLEAIARFQRDRVASMQVRAGAAGVVQSLSLQPGEWVNPGQELARVAGQDRLKAVIHVPEIDARDLALGLPAIVDTRNGTIAGHVSRVDPGAQNGTVGLDIALDGALPRGARPDLSVDAAVQLEKLDNATYVGRPAEGSSESVVKMFRLAPDGRSATRIDVKLGRGSATSVEILSGLKPGEQVILSEMSRYENADRVNLN